VYRSCELYCNFSGDGNLQIKNLEAYWSGLKYNPENQLFALYLVSLLPVK